MLPKFNFMILIILLLVGLVGVTQMTALKTNKEQLIIREAALARREADYVHSMVVGNWTLATSADYYPGIPHNYNFIYVEFYNDGTYATRPMALFMVDSHLNGTIIYGRYELVGTDQIKLDSSGSETLYQLSFSQSALDAGEIRQFMKFVPKSASGQSELVLLRCEGSLLAYPQYLDLWCVQGLKLQQ